MSLSERILTNEERESLRETMLHRERLEEQYVDLEQQHQTAAFGMWVFLATEVLFFGTLFLALGTYRYLYSEPFEKASARLCWQIGGINTIVLLVSSLMMAFAVHYAKLGRRKHIVVFLGLTALLGLAFLVLKGVEYYIDFQDNLVPGARFDAHAWVTKEGLALDQVRHVQLFLLLYWIMTGFHALHVTIGIGVVLIMLALAWRGHFSPAYSTPVEVTGLYWHFVDVVWIFLLPMLYLLGTHSL
jgi:cytochrome c oxidase subunit 3